MVILFQLMPYRQDGDCLVVVDLEQRDAPEAPNGMINSRKNGLSGVAFR